MFSRHLMKKFNVKIKFCSSKTLTNQINKNQPTAGIIIIGDEILKGQVLDTNSNFLTKRLYNLGIKVCQISIIGDIECDIIETVKDFSKRYTYVLTSGGIGPTHDDITFAAVAKAFGQPLIAHPELVKICSQFFNTQDMNSPQMKLAYIPKNSKLKFGYDKIQKRPSLYPNVSLNNIYLFPGIPQLMENLFDMVAVDLFGGSSTVFHHKELYFNLQEDQLASKLNKIVEKYPLVTIGSYPVINNKLFKVKVTFESLNEEILNEVIRELQKSISPEFLINHMDAFPESYRNIEEFSKFNHPDSFKKISTIFKQFQMNEIVVVTRTNLTKKILVLLHLIHYTKIKLNSDGDILIYSLNDKYDDLDKHMKKFVERYNFVWINSKDTSLSSFLRNHPQIKIIISSDLNDDEINLIKNNIELINPLNNWMESDISNYIKKSAIENYIS